jgi:plastocyanin
MTFAGRFFRHSRRALLPWLLLLAAPAPADTLAVAVKDDAGKPVEHAVVQAKPLGADGRPAPGAAPAVVDQINKEYVPYVTAVRVGTSVSFPNKDQIRHHVYSFSEAKKFEIPLYKGTPADPVVFDKPGPVVLGCNIHDWMKAYIFVSESPYFAVTGPGGDATIELPPGDYAVEVWHPELEGEPAATSQRISLSGAGSPLEFEIGRKRVWAPRRAPSRLGGQGYR